MFTKIDGKEVSAVIRKELKKKISKLPKDINLAVIMVGNDPASSLYINNKEKACKEVGIKSETIKLSETTTQEELEKLITEYNNKGYVDGILVQLPLPKHINTKAIMEKIRPDKDVDGFSPYNTGKLFNNEECVVACTPKGVMKLFEYYNIDLEGKNVVVLGRSEEVGKPLAHLCMQKNATVTICHSHTQNLSDITRNADILISAIGKPKFITASMVKPDAIVIDVGINRDENNKLCGDVDYENVKDKVSFITPVPGGVGPMTVTSLLENTYLLAKKHLDEDILDEDKQYLGYIYKNQMKEFDNNICWSLDHTIAIFLRDTLNFLADHSNGYPTCYDENWNFISKSYEETQQEDSDLKYQQWIDHLKEIANKFNFYLKDSEEFLDEEDKEFLSTYHIKYPVRFEPIGDGYSKMVNDAPEEDKARYHDIICNKEVAISERQLHALREALNDLGKIFSHLWD